MDEPLRDIDAYLDRACGHLGLGPNLKEHIRDELREHLLEAVEAHVACGVPRDDAVARAIQEFGDPGDVAEGLKGVYGRHVVSLLLEKAMEWRARTMKSGWKWTFVAHAMLAILIVAEIFFILGAVTYIFPVVQVGYQELGVAAPSYWRSTVAVVRFLFAWGLPLLGIGMAALAAFEWRYRNENKPMVRLAAGGTVAVALMVLVWVVAFAMSVPLVQLHFARNDERVAEVVRCRAVEAASAYREIEQALAAGQSVRAADAARQLSWVMSQLERSKAGVLGLAALDEERELAGFRDLLREVGESAQDVERRLQGAGGAEAKAARARLESAYARLTDAVDGWPKEP